MGAQRTAIGGITFDSKREAKRWGELKFLEQAGEITDLKRQVPFPLFGRDDAILTPPGRKMHYIADFTYTDLRLNGVRVVEDSKGWATEVFKIKKAILAAQGIEISEI